MTVHPPLKSSNLPETCKKTQPPTVHFEWRDWLPYTETSDLTEAQKKELIETLWSIIMAFVDLGWEVGSQHNTCGQHLDLTAAMRAAVLNSKDNNKEVP